VCRRVLVNAGFHLSNDEESVIFVTDCHKYDDDDDDDRGYDDIDDDGNDAACSARTMVERASPEHCDLVAEDDWF